MNFHKTAESPVLSGLFDLPAAPDRALATALTAALAQALRVRWEDPLAPLPVLDWGVDPDGLATIEALVAQVPEVSRFWQARDLAGADVESTLADLTLWMGKYLRETGRPGTAAQGWLVHHFTGGLVRLGRLQFQLGRAEAFGPVLDPNDIVLHVHIPEGEPLDAAACDASFQRAQDFFPRAFPALRPRAFVCDSWLLDPLLARILSPDSNIVRFQKGFSVFCGDGTDQQMRERVFGSPQADPLAAEATTGLQKAIQVAWKRGDKFQTARGVRLFPDPAPRPGV